MIDKLVADVGRVVIGQALDRKNVSGSEVAEALDDLGLVVEQASVDQPNREVYVVTSAYVPVSGFTRSFHNEYEATMTDEKLVSSALGLNEGDTEVVWGPETIDLSGEIPKVVSTEVEGLYQDNPTRGNLLIIIIIVIIAAVALALVGLFCCIYHAACTCCGGTADEEDK